MNWTWLDFAIFMHSYQYLCSKTLQSRAWLITLALITTATSQLTADTGQVPACYKLPNTNIEGVSLLSGNYLDFAVDLKTEGVDPISISRHFSPNLEKRWTYDFSRHLEVTAYGKHEFLIRYPDSQGGYACFTTKEQTKRRKGKEYCPERATFVHAPEIKSSDPTPILTGSLSGQHHLDNIRIEMWQYGNFITAYHGDGSTRKFAIVENKCPVRLPAIYKLIKETLPSGNYREYSYTKKDVDKLAKHEVQITTFTPTCYGLNKIIFNTLDGKSNVASHDGKVVDYINVPSSWKDLFNNDDAHNPFQGHRIESCISSDGTKTTYGYNETGKLCWKYLPDDRTLAIIYKNSSDLVCSIHQPMPNDFQTGKYEHSHFFSYPSCDKNTFCVNVTPRDGNAIEVVSEEGKIREYRRYSPPNAKGVSALYNKQKFYWGNKKGCEDLVTISVPHSENPDLAQGCRTFSYDDRHNMVQEILYGNLSGTCQAYPIVSSTGAVSPNKSESASRWFVYSNDGRNLLLSENDASGKVHSFSYKENTNLLAAELVGDGSRNIHRTFHSYNDHSARIETIIDDGSGTDKDDLTGVTMRRVTKLHVKQSGVGIGLPLMEEEFFLNEIGKLEPLQGRTNSYDDKGRLSTQKLFDTKGNCYQESSWSYDHADRVIKMTDPTGSVEYAYDANGNKILEHFLERGLTCYNIYDRRNHLIEHKEVDNQNQERIWRYRYNMLGQCIEEIDPLNNSTLHRFDGFGREVETQLPATSTAYEVLVKPIMKYTYDTADLKTEVTDGEGRVEKMAYNMRGQITRHTFSDGSVEIKEYTPTGFLKKSISPLGMVTEYKTDFIGRNLVKKEYNQHGWLIGQVEYSYQGLLLRSEKHHGGPTITYSYDGAGRLKESASNGIKKISYSYDTRGRQYQKKEWIDSASAKVTTHEYDQLDRVITESITDLTGLLLAQTRYRYDLQGNRTELIQNINDQIAITKTRYDAWNRVIEVTDPEGNSTCHRYETETNSSGQRVLKMITTDPKGRIKKILYNANNQVAEEEQLDSEGNLLRRHRLFYNGAQQLFDRRDWVYIDGRCDKEIITRWSYDKGGRVAQLTEALCTAEQRQTITSYYPGGSIKTIEFPDQTVHAYTYDNKGQCLSHYDKEKTFCFKYIYDHMGRVIESTNQLADGTVYTTRRSYDIQGRMIKEELGNGLVIHYQHDLLGRVTQITLPDASRIVYNQDAAYLRKVSRLDTSGTVCYTHTYDHIDLSGNTVHMQLAGAGGSLHTTHNLRGLIQSIEHPNWLQTIPHDGYDAVGNLLEYTLQDPVGIQAQHYAYDALDQLSREEGTSSHHYTYDSLYNRQVEDGVKGTFNSLNQLLKRGDSSYEYDKKGCIRSIQDKEGKQKYTYDGLGRLLSIECDNERTTYGYDTFHRRLTKTHFVRNSADEPWSESETERFLYLDQNEVGSCDKKGHFLSFRVLGRGRGAEIGASIALELKNAIYVPIHDQSGSITALLDFTTGNIVEHARYSAFGKAQLFNATQEEIITSGVGNPWGFASKRFDPENGWNFFGRRYYDANEGRWITPDPLGFSEGPNLYAYVQNSPMTHSDLYGLEISFYAMPIHNMPQALTRAMSTQGTVCRLNPQAFQHLRPYAQMPGRALEMFSRHLLPIPIARDILMGIGRVLSFRPFGGCEICAERPSFNFIAGEHDNPNGDFRSFVNGICNSPQDAKESALSISRAYQNEKIYTTYNATRGLCLDLIRSVYMMFGGTTEASRKLAQGLNYLNEKSPSSTIFHIAHSQGGQVTWGARHLLKKSTARMMDVTTYGSAHLIEQGFFKETQNCVSTRDAIPLLANPLSYGRAKAGKMGNVQFLPGFGLWGLDHAVNGQTYNGHIVENADKSSESCKRE